jgi:TRAP-type C4-dicarboxylate transport system permease small subunit
MRRFVIRLSNYMSVVAGIVLILMAVLTFADIVMRLFGRPIPGIYEVVALLGLAVVGFALPRSSFMKAHVGVDLMVEKASQQTRKTMLVGTRILVAAFFLISAWYFVGMAQSFIAAKMVTMTLRVPLYPVVFVMVLSFFVQALVAICQIFEKGDGGHNE